MGCTIGILKRNIDTGEKNIVYPLTHSKASEVIEPESEAVEPKSKSEAIEPKSEVIEPEIKVRADTPITLNKNDHMESTCEQCPTPLIFLLPSESPHFVEPIYANAARQFSIDTSRAKTNKKVVSLCAKMINLHEFPEGRDDEKPCDIYWHNIIYSDMKIIARNGNVRINKFPGMAELSKKIALTRAILSMKQIFHDEYRFYPLSWFIPTQLQEFTNYCSNKENNIWNYSQSKISWFIVKPDDGSQGTGIYLINNPDQLKDTNSRQLVQAYIDHPYLMNDGLKFDFRIYAVIKSINPLSIYVAREGMARFCTEKYNKPTLSSNLYAHLTNYSLNKANESYIHSNSLYDQLKGSKRLLSTVFHQLEAKGVKTKRLWHNIKLIIVKTIIAMVPEIMLNYEHCFSDSSGAQCFQIMGFDILLTEELEPVLLEVNSAPSLTIDHCVAEADENTDCQEPRARSITIKIPLVRDTLLLVLDLMDRVYGSTYSNFPSSECINQECMDDIEVSKFKRKSNLTEVFPGRYGLAVGHLLFLDKAAYLFMQFVNLKHNMLITITGLRNFIRKCNLMDVIDANYLQAKYSEILNEFNGEDKLHNECGLPFHGFLKLLYYIAQLKFFNYINLFQQVNNLLTYCCSSLRHYGVRSARLRRIEIDDNDKENLVKIYLLPIRLQQKRLGRLDARLRSEIEAKRARQRYARSLPRDLKGFPTNKNGNFPGKSFRNNRKELILPKIRQTFH